MSDRIEEIIIQTLFDKNIRVKVKEHLELWMFENKVHSYIIDSLLDNSFDNKEIDRDIFILSVENKNQYIEEIEYKEICGLYDTHKKIKDEDLPYVINIISDFIKKKLYWKGIDLMSKNKNKEAEVYINKAYTFSIQKREFISGSNIEAVEEYITINFPVDGKYIKSSLELINQNTVFKGLRRGDLIMVAAPTGVGKSTFLTQESVVLCGGGFKGGYVIIGDNQPGDIIIKSCTYLSKEPMEIIKDNYKYYLDIHKNQLNNANVISYPSGSVKVGEILSDAKNLSDIIGGLDFLIVDYDGNISRCADNMYDSASMIYRDLKGFAEMNNCVVFVGSQVKPDYCDKELLDKTCPNESSAKQNHVDMMITINANKDYKGVGSINIAKSRRGPSNIFVRVQFNYSICEIKEISEENYLKLISSSKKAAKDDYTIEDLEL